MKIKKLLLLIFPLLIISCDKNNSDNPDPIESQIRVTNITEIPCQELVENFSQQFMMDLTNSKDVELMDEFETNMENMRPESQWWIAKITFTYPGELADGHECQLSGAIFMNWWDYMYGNNQKGIILANHFTIGSNAEAPSVGNTYEAYLCQLGYVVVMPDYLGFGSTSGVPQAYLHAKSTAKASIGAFMAVDSVLKKVKYKGKVGGNHYNLGYSQGGHTAMAVHRMVQEEYSDKIKFKKTIAAGGPQDILATYESFVSTNKTGIPAAIPLIVTGMNYAEDLKLDYKTVFLNPLLSNYKDWIITKRYTTDEITKKMGGYNLPVDKILHPNALDSNNSQTVKLLAALKKNSMTNGWVPSPKANPIYIFHSTQDDVVPVINANNMYDFLRKNGVTPSIETAEYGNHMDAGKLFFARSVLLHIEK